MEHVPHIEQKTSAESYEHIVVIQLNGESRTMCKCINCNIVTMNSSFNLWKHWKYTCPYKMLFKYNYPTTHPDRSNDMSITCLVCQNIFYETTIGFMTTHRKYCKETTQVEVQRLSHSDRSSPSITTSPSRTDDASEGTQSGDSPNHSTTSTYRIEPTNETSMRFVIKKTSTLEKSRRSAECQICKNLFVTSSNNPLQTCNQCNDSQSKTTEPEQDVLISVQTVHSTKHMDTSNPLVRRASFPTGTELHDFMGHENDSSITEDETNVYPCRLCNKRYSTMANIYCHVRAQHSRFLCSLCMNMFEHEAELKEHIHKCPKSNVNRPQCVVCKHYFSNSWSLARHIQVHVSAGECDPDILTKQRVKDIEKGDDDPNEIHDSSNVVESSQDEGFLSLTNADSSLLRQQSEICFICNTTTSESFADLYGTTAAHSGKCIFNFVWKFLGGKPSVRNDTMDASSLTQDVVCSECLGMINEYDKARVTEKRYKKLLRNKLANTENYYERLQSEDDGCKKKKNNFF